MTLNGIALVLALQADFVTVVEGRPIMSAKYHLQLHFAKTDPRSSRTYGLFATAKLLITPYYRQQRLQRAYNKCC